MLFIEEKKEITLSQHSIYPIAVENLNLDSKCGMLFVEVIIIAASVLYDGVKTTCCAKTIQRGLSAVSS